MRRGVFFVLAPFGFAAFLALGGLIVQQLWNWLLPTLFGWPVVTFWQALGLLALCRILFGGGGRLRGWSHGGGRGGWRSRWETLTPEEREVVRQRMRARWGMGPSDGTAAGR